MTVGLGPASEPELPGTASLDKPGASLRHRERVSIRKTEQNDRHQLVSVASRARALASQKIAD